MDVAYWVGDIDIYINWGVVRGGQPGLAPDRKLADFRFSVTSLDKTRVNRALEASQKASKTRHFQGPHLGIILDDRRLDLPGKTRVFLHAHA